MMHVYEIRKLEKNGKVTTIRMVTAEPKAAKKAFKKCDGAKYSYHMRGMAADIRVNGMSAKELANKLNEVIPDGCGIIVYKNWVHFDVRTGKKYRKGI